MADEVGFIFHNIQTMAMQTWLIPTLEKTYIKDLVYAHRFHSPTLHKTSITGDTSVKAWLSPIIAQSRLIVIYPLRSWINLKIPGACSKIVSIGRHRLQAAIDTANISDLFQHKGLTASVFRTVSITNLICGAVILVSLLAYAKTLTRYSNVSTSSSLMNSYLLYIMFTFILSLGFQDRNLQQRAKFPIQELL
jgi:hypothetical protein